MKDVMGILLCSCSVGKLLPPFGAISGFLNLAFLGKGLGIVAVATAAPVVVVDSKVFAKQFGQMCHTRVKGTIRYRTVDQDDGWTGPNLVESNCRAVLRSDCLHGILLFFPFY